MEILNKKTAGCILVFLLGCLTLFAQDARVLLEFEDAEKALNNGDFQGALDHLDDVEKQAGITSRTLYLRIVAEYRLFTQDRHLYRDEKGFTHLQGMRGNVKKYLSALSEQPIDDKYREVYQISKALEAFPKTRQQWQMNYHQLQQQDAAQKDMAVHSYFEAVGHFSGGLCPVKRGGLWGVIDREGNLVLRFQFEDLRNFHHGLAAAKMAGKWGFINAGGTWVVPASYDEVGSFSGGPAGVRNNRSNRTFYLDTTGQIVIRLYSKVSGGFSDGLAVFKGTNGRYGYMDKRGRAVIKPQYRHARAFKDGVAFVNTSMLIDKTGRVLFSGVADSTDNFSEDRSRRCINGKVEYIDKRGRTINATRYADGRSFSEGMAAVKVGDHWGFIDQSGRQVIACQFIDVQSFGEGLAAAALRDNQDSIQIGFIDHSGHMRIRLPPDCQSAGAFHEGMASFEFNGKWGFMDKDNHVLKLKNLP